MVSGFGNLALVGVQFNQILEIHFQVDDSLGCTCYLLDGVDCYRLSADYRIPHTRGFSRISVRILSECDHKSSLWLTFHSANS